MYNFAAIFSSLSLSVRTQLLPVARLVSRFLPPVSIAAALLAAPVQAAAQDDDALRSIVYLTGAESIESLDEAEAERFYEYLASPLEINLLPRSRLLACGLFSQYQVASLVDYRSRSGDVFSIAELATVDGFGERFAEALRPFISLRSASLPGQPDTARRRWQTETLANLSVKNDQFRYGLKHKTGYGGLVDFSAAVRSAYSENILSPPGSVSMNLTYYGKRRLSKVVVGDFNVRFGQGLALWSGMALSGLSTSASFSRRPSGVTPSYSWNGTGGHSGVAVDFSGRRHVLSTFVSLPGLREWCVGGKPPDISLLLGANISFQRRRGQFSFTGTLRGGSLGTPLKPEGGKLAGDFRWSHRGVDLFGEAAWDFSGGGPGAVAGLSARLGDDWRLSSVARFYPEEFDSEYAGGVKAWLKARDEAGLALGLERGGAYLTLDYAMRLSDSGQRQLKGVVSVPVQLSPAAVLTLRATERIRPYEEPLRYRTDARCDLDWSSAGLSARYDAGTNPAWKARLRLEGILCRSLSGLSYVEGGRKTDRFSAYLRGTVFIVDNWDDRIYSYERDAPGSFNVPAYYGRGWSLSAVCGCKFRLSGGGVRGRDGSDETAGGRGGRLRRGGPGSGSGDVIARSGGGRGGRLGGGSPGGGSCGGDIIARSAGGPMHRAVLRVYLRAAAVSYSFMAVPKPSTYEVKLQVVLQM